MTDAHVHFRDWNQSEKETVYHGMLTGAKAGFDVFFDMPNTNPPVTDSETARRRIELGLEAQSRLKDLGHDVHYHIYLGLTPDPIQISDVVNAYNKLFPQVCGLKMFASQSTGNMGIIGKEAQLGIFKALAEQNYRGVLAIHCEKEELFDLSAVRHCDRRPSSSEETSVRDQIENVQKSDFKGTLHIAHVSTEGALQAIRDAREWGVRITCGATPHHALLTCANETDMVKMNPPLRDESDRLALWNALFDGTVNWVESDHAPHTLKDKENGACGLPGFEGMLILMEKLRSSGMSEKRLNELFCTNALRSFGIDEPSSPVPQVTDTMKSEARTAYPFSAWA